ncbi:hypothetical protein H4Q26_001879 [Puccinia striiformis f. sp. tritici PST-130]|nr:hypothetical protein H4Q26_001879 [Puccinia striiformis f. sp. tritici PST-130]
MSSLLPKLFSRPIPVISTTRRSVSIAAVLAVEPKVPKLLNSLLHGSEEARKQNEAFQSHSTTVGSKTISEVQKHRVLPQHVDQYKEIIGAYFEKLSSQTDLNMTLKALLKWSWASSIHLGYDYATSKMRERAEHQEFTKSIRSLVNSRNSHFVGVCILAMFRTESEWRNLRDEKLSVETGTLLEWETEWRRGLEARRKFVEPIGAWFAQVGRHQVHHMWQYPSLQARLELREKAWQVDTWSNTVSTL